MGQLTTLGFATSSVKTPRGEIVLRGITLEDVLRVARLNGEAFVTLFDKVTAEQATAIDLEDTGKLMVSMAETAPKVVADIIAHAADDPDGSEVARKLPFSVQLECLQQIARLTFEPEGGVKKVLETLLEMAQAVGGLMTELRQQKSGSLASGAK
jgi:hypothetical protein